MFYMEGVIMKYSEEQILDALKIIKNICIDMGDHDCNICPLGTYDGECCVKNTLPENWNIKIKQGFKAFEMT